MLHIVWNEAECERTRNEGRDDYSSYLFEMLNYLGFSYDRYDQASWMKEQPRGVTIVIGVSGFEGWDTACTQYCQAGNALLAIGGVYGLQETLGVHSVGRMQEGWIVWEEDSPAQGLLSSFHCFDATLVETTDLEMEIWGKWVRRNGADHANPVLTVRRIGHGSAVLIGFDLPKTVCMIQQGISVVRDGIPAPDGTAFIDEGFLKTDDGTVLDWHRDRNCPKDGTSPFYVHPIVDEMRIFLARVLYMLQDHAGVYEAQTWFWPNGLTAIGHISHDTDGNDEELAGIMLDKLDEAGVRSTWCTIMPGYPGRVYDRIKRNGHEIAFHYNALGTEIAESDWKETHFRYQLEMLQLQVSDRNIVSNKNHYLRWEGDTAFYRWCESAGIHVEQSKGGTKQGNKGYLFGTCHPNAPVGTAAERNRLFNVINLPTLAWDPPVSSRCTAQEAKTLLHRSYDVYGVAHFLFHPGIVAQGSDTQTVGDFLVELCMYGKQLGMEWWTSEQLWRWFQARRQVRIVTEGHEVSIVSEEAMQGVTLLLPQRANVRLTVKGQHENAIRSITHKERFGRTFVELVLDIGSGTTTVSLSPEA